MRDKLRKVRVITFIPALILMYVIFGFSDENGDESSSISLTVTTDIVETVDAVIYDDQMEQSLYQQLIDKLHTPVRKGAHVSEYLLLSLCVFCPLFLYPVADTIWQYIITYGWCFIYACTDEFHQTFIADRTGRFVDVLIDMSGVTVFLLVTFFVFYRKKLLTYRK